MKKSESVSRFLFEKKHPLTEEIELVRSIILETDQRIEETIKWCSPTFMYKGKCFRWFAKDIYSLQTH